MSVTTTTPFEFLVLTAFVIALGTGSTNRYERGRRAQARSAHPATRPIRVVPTT